MSDPNTQAFEHEDQGQSQDVQTHPLHESLEIAYAALIDEDRETIERCFKDAAGHAENLDDETDISIVREARQKLEAIIASEEFDYEHIDATDNVMKSLSRAEEEIMNKPEPESVVMENVQLLLKDQTEVIKFIQETIAKYKEYKKRAPKDKEKAIADASIKLLSDLVTKIQKNNGVTEKDLQLLNGLIKHKEQHEKALKVEKGQLGQLGRIKEMIEGQEKYRTRIDRAKLEQLTALAGFYDKARERITNITRILSVDPNIFADYNERLSLVSVQEFLARAIKERILNNVPDINAITVDNEQYWEALDATLDGLHPDKMKGLAEKIDRTVVQNKENQIRQQEAMRQEGVENERMAQVEEDERIAQIAQEVENERITEEEAKAEEMKYKIFTGEVNEDQYINVGIPNLLSNWEDFKQNVPEEMHATLDKIEILLLFEPENLPTLKQIDSFTKAKSTLEYAIGLELSSYTGCSELGFFDSTNMDLDKIYSFIEQIDKEKLDKYLGWITQDEQQKNRRETEAKQADEAEEKERLNLSEVGDSDIAEMMSRILEDGDNYNLIDDPNNEVIKDMIFRHYPTKGDLKKLESTLFKSDKVISALREKAKLLKLDISSLSEKIKTKQSALRGVSGYGNNNNNTDLQGEIDDLIDQKKGKDLELGNINDDLKSKRKTTHYESTWQVLAMIFADTNKGTEMTEIDIINQMHKAIDDNRFEPGKRSFLTSFFKPTLKRTLSQIAQDEFFKKNKLDASQLEGLNGAWKTRKEVQNWLRGLEIKENIKMEEIVPQIIAYLELAIQEGNSSYLHNRSIDKAKSLVEHLTSLRNIHVAKKTREKFTGDEMEFMSAYFENLNKATATKDDITEGLITSKWRNIAEAGKGIGIGTATYFGAPTALSILSFSTSLTAGGIVGGGLAIGSRYVKNERTKKMMQTASLPAGIATSAMMLTGIGLVPAAIIGGLGLGAAAYVKHRDKVDKSVGNVTGAASTAWKAGGWTLKNTWGALKFGTKAVAVLGTGGLILIPKSTRGLILGGNKKGNLPKTPKPPKKK